MTNLKIFLIAMTALYTPAQASPSKVLHSCEAPDGYSLSVKQSMNADSTVYTTLSGPHEESFTGWQNLGNGKVQVTSISTGEKATLIFSYPPAYGGRCGRCEPIQGSPWYYVNLVTPEAEYSFTCLKE